MSGRDGGGRMVEADEGKRGKERNVGQQKKKECVMEEKERVHAFFYVRLSFPPMKSAQRSKRVWAFVNTFNSGRAIVLDW